MPAQTVKTPSRTANIVKVVSIPLQPNTIATIFGTIQDAAVTEQVVLLELFGKGITVEKTAKLDGKKGRPCHVVGVQGQFAVVWGPFAEEKKIQVAVYWTDLSGNGLEPIDTIQELSDDKSRTKVTLLSVLHHDKEHKMTLRTVVNVTCTRVRA